ncbi:MAG: hydroxyethylthiazole kinase [Candidatus Methanomethylophilaceae archaeon]|nr:hydroxyethylthiazole kinase [Candidatus Methanomethylophilaceae archaeon]
MRNVRSKHPLVHHITNYVTVNDCANICICSGGSPVMTDEMKDLNDMVSISNAVVLNMGTLNERTVESMISAGKIAKSKGIPVLFDAVGAGATAYRNQVAKMILDQVKPDVVKGNDGEISFLAGIEGGVRGVDSTSSSGDMASIVKGLASKLGCVVASTGAIDHVSDGNVVFVLKNGHEMEGNVSGTGCMVSSVIGSYIGANGVNCEAVVSAITAFNIAAEHSARGCKGPGSFKVGLFDSLFNLEDEEFDNESKIEKI